MRSTFQLSVPQHLYDATCDACGQGFADCHLYGAKLAGTALTTRTLTAAIGLERDGAFKAMADKLGIKIIRPTPYPGEGDRPSAKQAKEQLTWG